MFMLPGVFLVLPGGLLGARFGGRAVMLSGLVLMTIGALPVANSLALGAPFYPFYVALAGRLVGGMGGVVVNVQLTKAVTDWFSHRIIATAMGLRLSGWPFGIALVPLVAGSLQYLAGTPPRRCCSRGSSPASPWPPCWPSFA